MKTPQELDTARKVARNTLHDALDSIIDNDVLDTLNADLETHGVVALDALSNALAAALEAAHVLSAGKSR